MKINYIINLFVCTLMMFLVVIENNGKKLVVVVTLKEILYQKYLVKNQTTHCYSRKLTQFQSYSDKDINQSCQNSINLGGSLQ